MRKPKIGIIGAGRWGQNLLREFNQIAVVKYFSNKSNLDLRERLKREYPNSIATFNYREIIGDCEIEAVAIATPIKTHYKIVKESLLAGKHVFVEKPICTKIEEGTEIVNLAKSKNLTLAVGYIFLYDKAYQFLKREIDLSQIKCIKFLWDKWGTFDEDILDNLVSHEIAIAIDWYNKKPKGINVNYYSRDAVDIKLDFYDNKQALIVTNRANPSLKRKSILIETKEGHTFLWENGDVFKLIKGKYEKIYHPHIRPLEIECNDFVKSICSGSKPISDGEMGLKVLETLVFLKNSQNE